ncbi:MAG: PEGA domain-containing protein [Candidatus Omnitrophica bacterium]|nr:PEGA domain-containing protein [Candidatus Omnitrophota bacterium]
MKDYNRFKRGAKMLILGAGLMGLAGCATMMGVQRVAGQGTIDVTSKPTDAEVYLNNFMVGRTPCKVPFTFTIDTYTGMPIETYVIRIHKEGYKDIAEAFQWVQVYGPSVFDVMGPWKFNLQTKRGVNNFNFVLEKIGGGGESNNAVSGSEKKALLLPDEKPVGKISNDKENKYLLFYENGNTIQVDKQTFESVGIKENQTKRPKL